MNNPLVALRKARQLSQRECARQVGISQPRLSDLENGKATPSLKEAAKFATLYGIQIEDIWPLEELAEPQAVGG